MSNTRELLVKKIEDEAVKRARRQCSSGCPYTDKVWQRHLRIGFEDGAKSLVDLIVELDECLAKIEEDFSTDFCDGNTILAQEARAKLHKFW